MRTTLMFVGDENGLRDYPRVGDRRRSIAQRDPEFGRQVTQRRLALKMSQKEFSYISGIHEVSLSRVETATSPLTDKMRKRIEDALNELEAR